MQIRTRAAGMALAALAAVALSTLPSHASHSVQGTYTIGTTPVLSVVCSPDCLGTGDPSINLGGFTFDPEGEVPASVTIADQSMGPVSFTVCQDLSAALCGEAGEPRVDGCGTTADLSTSLVAFRLDKPTSVFIRLVGPTQPAGCMGLGLGGTITLTYTGAPV